MVGPRRPFRLRRQGIRGQLLNRLLTEADAAQIQEIVGSVMPDAILVHCHVMILG